MTDVKEGETYTISPELDEFIRKDVERTRRREEMRSGVSPVTFEVEPRTTYFMTMDYPEGKEVEIKSVFDFEDGVKLCKKIRKEKNPDLKIALGFCGADEMCKIVEDEKNEKSKRKATKVV